LQKYQKKPSISYELQLVKCKHKQTFIFSARNRSA